MAPARETDEREIERRVHELAWDRVDLDGLLEVPFTFDDTDRSEDTDGDE
jgi:hypothetical protein